MPGEKGRPAPISATLISADCRLLTVQYELNTNLYLTVNFDPPFHLLLALKGRLSDDIAPHLPVTGTNNYSWQPKADRLLQIRLNDSSKTTCAVTPIAHASDP